MTGLMKYLCIILLFSNPFYAISQELNQPTAGFDTTAYHPIFIQSANKQFKLNIGLYTQFRYNANFRSNVPDSVQSFSNGYNLARTRIFLEGDLTNKFYYHFRVNINPSGNVELLVAYLQWSIKNNIRIRMGRQFMALGREDWILPQDLASMEFSAHDFTFAIWTSFGFQLNHIVNNKFRYWVGVSNGSYGGRKQFPAPTDSDIMLNGRTEWNIIGSDWDIWEDMLGRRGQEFGMLLGVAAAHNLRFDQSELASSPSNGTQLNVDFSISGEGYHFFIQGSTTLLNFDPNYSTRQDFQMSGFYSTFGYWLTKNIFPYARLDGVFKGTHESKTEDYISPGVGLSYYPFTWSNRIRFTLEYNYLSATLNNTVVEPDGQLGLVQSPFGGQQSIRFQAQFGF
jgi:hypothetical protein